MLKFLSNVRQEELGLWNSQYPVLDIHNCIHTQAHTYVVCYTKDTTFQQRVD